MKSYHLISLFSLLCHAALGQTMIIDYSEHIGENKAEIHVMETKLPIEKETFNDIAEAKTKLVRMIENYRTVGYLVRSSTVSSHKHKRDFHYHYQYILQKADINAEDMTGASEEEQIELNELREQILQRRRMLRERQLQLHKNNDSERSDGTDTPALPETLPQ